MAQTPEHFDPEPQAEILDDRVVRLGGGSVGRRLGLSVPGAIAGAFLVTALAFGAALTAGSPRDGAGHDGPPGVEPSDDLAAADPTEPWVATDATDEPGAPTPKAEPTKEPTAEPTEKAEPTAKPTPKPDPTKPTTEGPTLWLGQKDGKPVIEWSACSGFTFDYYKVVRSTDATVSWPLGEGDELIGVVEPGGSRRAWDEGAPTGVQLWYRVFCVRSTEYGYKVLAASNVKSITLPPAPDATPAPDPVAIALEATVTDGGAVHLSWDACPADGYAYTKVLRSTTTDAPSYLPWADGTEILAVLGDPYAVGWSDTGPAVGKTAWYRIQCIGSWNGMKVLLGQSAVVAVTLPQG